MAVLSLPLSFNNSFWTQDYRRGLEVLYSQLEQGIAENDEIIAFIRARATAETAVGAALSNVTSIGTEGRGFAADDGASLLMAFRGLQGEAARQGDAHVAIAKELHTLVADPFQEWAVGHKDRVRQNKASMIEQYLWAYEHAQADVAKLKNQYLSKVRRADEAEDDARFAPTSTSQDKYTTSPRLGPLGPPEPQRRPPREPPQRTASVSERIAARLKEIQRRTAANVDSSETTASLDGAVAEATNGAKSETEEKSDADEKSEADETEESDTEGEKSPLTSAEKGKGRAVETSAPAKDAVLPPSPPPLSPPLPPKKLEPLTVPTTNVPQRGSSPMPPTPASPIIFAGLSLPPPAVSSLLTRAAEELPLRPIRFPILGEYADCFSGEEFVTWLLKNVEALEGSWDRAEEAARELAEAQGLLRRVGEFGNQFESADDAYYQFRPKAFELSATATTPTAALSSPTKRSFASAADNLVKRSGTLANFVSRAINANQTQEPPYVRTRREAEEADHAYRVAVRKLDRQRLGLEERVEETLKTLQRWETDRLRAVKTVLLQFQGTLANLPKSLEPSLERSSTLIASYQPEGDLTALIEQHRTGPFRPAPQVYESIAHDEADVVFGIDLRKWAEGGWDSIKKEDGKTETVPPVLTALLSALEEVYPKLANDAEKRKSWIYEVPLAAVHHLREAIHGIDPGQPIPTDMLTKYDAPVLASAVKLWMLELDPPLALWEGWDDIRRIYPSMGSGAKAEGEKTDDERVQEVQAVLERLPRVHLYVLDTLLRHFINLIKATKGDESTQVYATKLGLTMGRTICRPKYESQISIQERHPTLLFMDLLRYHSELLPPTIAKKKRESERKIPIRKRTAPIDMRIHRSRLSVGADPRAQLAAQESAAKGPALSSVSEAQAQKASVPTAAPATKSIPPPPPVAPAPANTGAPPRPTFKEPPAEDEGVPPRPSFKEPHSDDEGTPPMPSFKSPPAEVDSVPAPPPMPPRFTSPPPEDDDASGTSAIPSPAPKPAELAPAGEGADSPRSPAADDRMLAAKASLSRSGSNEAARTRGPRPVGGARGPRQAGGSVSNMVASLNKATGPGSAASSPISPSSSTGFRPTHRVGGSVAGRPASPGLGTAGGTDKAGKRLSRAAAFTRKAVASDAED